MGVVNIYIICITINNYIENVIRVIHKFNVCLESKDVPCSGKNVSARYYIW